MLSSTIARQRLLPSFASSSRLLLSVCLLTQCTRLFTASSATMASARKNVVIKSASTHTSTLIFMHGLGDSADGGWASVAPDFQENLPGLKVILPNAPITPVTLNGGMKMPSWHDIKSLNNIDNEDFAGLDESRQMINTIINDEIEAGIPSNKIVVGGFSQGSGLAVYTALLYPQKLGGILLLSGYLPAGGSRIEQIKKVDKNKQTPLLMCHGEIDQVVNFKIGQRSFKTIQELRPENAEFKSYKNVGHHSSEEEISDIVKWMKKILG